jgi:hypothetical protein
MNADARSRTIDPVLDSARLYRPLAGSPALDTAETLAEVRTDYSGTPRPLGPASDIGAHEGTAQVLSPPTNFRIVR